MRTPYRKPGKYSLIPSDPHMSEEKLVMLHEKLAALKRNHPHAASEVSRLAELGDFSENTEYQMAKAKLRGILFGISKIEQEIKNAVLIPRATDNDSVELGHHVTILVEGVEKTYTILGSSETNPSKNVISHLSPIGSALMGKRVGDSVTIHLANRDSTYQIIAIE